ncbi:MAG: hypothetical protein FK732_12130 [Asgard group archaeon]|nr:hypothetical protein [Asgard group archaeon]
MKKVNLYTFFIIFFVACSSLISSTSADYYIKSGDAFRFEILTLRTLGGFAYKLYDPLSDLVFEEGDKMLIKFTDVHPLDVDFTITIDGITGDGNPFFDNIIVQNRNWDVLTEKYENQGYNISETNDLWMVRQYNSTILEADYSKKNGVMKRFYAYNESQLVDVLHAGEIEIIRLTEDSISHNWAYSFLAVIPITGFLIYFFRRKKLATKA